MGASKIMFNDHRQKELDEAGKASKKRIWYREKVVNLVKGLKGTKEESKQIDTLIKLEPYYCFDAYILAVGDAPIWYIEHVLEKYSKDDQYNISYTHKLFLEGILLKKKNNI